MVSGWSALAALDANFADFANISVSGKMSTIGFGSIDKTPNQRSREEQKQYGFMSSLNMGQFYQRNGTYKFQFLTAFQKSLLHLNMTLTIKILN